MKIKGLQAKAHQLRQQEFVMCISAAKGHLGGAFSITEIMVGIYYSGFSIIIGLRCFNSDNKDRSSVAMNKLRPLRTLFKISI